jgi:hypothetical protein
MSIDHAEEHEQPIFSAHAGPDPVVVPALQVLDVYKLFSAQEFGSYTFLLGGSQCRFADTACHTNIGERTSKFLKHWVLNLAVDSRNGFDNGPQSF